MERTVNMAKKEVKPEIENSCDARIKVLHERLGELTYLITERTTELNKQLHTLQDELNQDVKLREMQKAANRVATELEALKKK